MDRCSFVANFYPRPPRGGRPATHGPKLPEFWISIHALREEGDGNATVLGAGGNQFLSTPSARRATGDLSELAASIKISIHALREEGDVHQAESIQPVEISIHALREEGDTDFRGNIGHVDVFLSTPSARRATPVAIGVDVQGVVFLSTPSARRATGDFAKSVAELLISIHALREEGDRLRRALR